MSTRSVSRRYARALFELSAEGVRLHEDLARLSEVVRIEQIMTVVERVDVSPADKAGVLVRAAGKVSKEAARLVQMLCERGKAALLPEIAEIYEELEREAAAEVVAEVVVATKLASGMEEKLSKALAKSVGKKVRLSVNEDSAIIGGVIVRIGDRQIDYSVRSRLEGLRRAIAA